MMPEARCGSSGAASGRRPDTGTIMHYWRSLRPQQWIKNAFVWAGFLFAHAWHDPSLAGTLGVGIAPSPWLLMCGLMLTLLLGFGKRRAELVAVTGDSGRAVLAEYSPALLDRLITVCVSGTLISYSLYTISPQTIALHGSANLVYTVPIVTYGLFRYLYLLDRQYAAEDPSRLLLTDHHLQGAALAWLAAVVWVLTHGS